MSRGFLSGMIMGGVVGSVGLAVASQIARPPGTIWPAASPSLEAAAVAAPQPSFGPAAIAPDPAAASGPTTDLAPPAGSEFARPLPEVAPVLPAADTIPARSEAPVVAAPAAAEPEAPDTSTAARPQPVPLEPAAPPAPEAEAAAPAVPALATPAAVRSDGAPQPGAPAAEAGPSAADLPPPPPLTAEEEAMLAQAAAPEGEPAAPAGTGQDLPRLLEPDPPGAPGDPAASRLPRIGEPSPETAPVPEVADLPPIRRHARPFENAQKKPLFSILLRDTGGPDLDREALCALPFPVTFVIDPQAPDAATAASMYRAAGHEVLMLATGIPDGAQPSDIEVTLEAAATALPEAVGLIDLPQAGFQSARSLSTQVVQILEAQGRGLVTHDRGLNAADQVARREGLPTALVFRNLDAEGAQVADIRRTLDRAAFKAAQEGQVTVYGETRPETVQGLIEWTVEGRADSVALAPVTAVMR
ncbi:divergent polysaccharide deacetylase family protein [Cereibacter sphaeroides]|uniref:divergent polysaccharide deacetylase family protein n=1 Tax=Cereibacter sphaeroides TaxID=1063 RepID=UPI001F1E3069|nr:divergent polysaccharide deacetylase family protein [Cereibacter sphaeroides]MCE6950171.1 divergent polysaccharide deacetylase family protein [Cereibacter sphaeroides]